MIILLDDSSVSFCHSLNPVSDFKLIPLGTLKEGIRWGMKENLMIQFVYPHRMLPLDYKNVIDSIDHVNIAPAASVDSVLTETSDVLVLDAWRQLADVELSPEMVYSVMTTKDELFKNYKLLGKAILNSKRINLVLTDVCDFSDNDSDSYTEVLDYMSSVVVSCFIKERRIPQVNILTDRLYLSEMHNCNAGIESITLAPDGQFYLCPSFYYSKKSGAVIGFRNDEDWVIGSMTTGLDIPNASLLQLSHAPICKRCDSYHCNRCIWQNYTMTGDLNTPSHQQCLVSVKK